jgi:hypothetical protein
MSAIPLEGKEHEINWENNTQQSYGDGTYLSVAMMLQYENKGKHVKHTARLGPSRKGISARPYINQRVGTRTMEHRTRSESITS